MDAVHVMAADGAIMAVSAECVAACATLAHVTQHCTGGAIPVPFQGELLTRFFAALGEAGTTVPVEHLLELVVVADYLACHALMDSLCRRLAANITSEVVSSADLSLEVWSCVAQHVSLPAGCALALARPELAGVFHPRLQELAKGVRLADACRDGHLAVCQWLTETFHLTAADARADDNLALRWAASNGHLPMCQWLTETFHLTAEDARADGNYALHCAAQNGHLAVCQWLTETFHLTTKDARADCNYALQCAAQNGHLPVCQWMTDRFELTAADARALDNYALRWAANNGHLAVCQWLTETFGITP